MDSLQIRLQKTHFELQNHFFRPGSRPSIAAISVSHLNTAASVPHAVEQAWIVSFFDECPTSVRLAASACYVGNEKIFHLVESKVV